jgi:hypothetical protein
LPVASAAALPFATGAGASLFTASASIAHWPRLSLKGRAVETLNANFNGFWGPSLKYRVHKHPASASRHRRARGACTKI